MMARLVAVLCLVVAVMCAGAAWFWTRYAKLENRVEQAEATVKVLEASRSILDKVLLEQRQLEDNIRSIRRESDKALEDIGDLSGPERIDALQRLLEKDAAARGDKPSGKLAW